MNLVYKFKQILSVMGVLVILSPATVLAANSDRAAMQAQNAANRAAAQAQKADAQAAKTQARVNAFCTNLSNSTRPMVAKVQENRGKATSDWASKDAALNAEWKQADEKITSARALSDKERTADYEKLMAKAKTDDQKAAVEAYEQAVNSAVAARRSSYDAARQTFRSSVLSNISARRSAAQTQLSTFQASVSSAISTAQASCASNPTDISGIKSTLQANLKSARETFQASRGTEKQGAVNFQVQQLAATRNASFESANKTFKSAMSEARATLQKAFNNSTSI